MLSGSIAPAGSGYGLTLKASESVTGTVILDTSGRASGKDDVLAVATTLGNRIRTALGDDTSDSAQRFATETLSATSLDVVREYAMAMQALSNSKFDDARQSFGAAVKLDPNFGLAYAGMAIASSNMGQPQEAATYVQEAIRHVDKMTERERFRTRGMFYLVTNDYEACVKEYGDLLARYEADAAARNNLALCSTKLRDMARAREEMQRVVEILPKRSLYRVNAALYSAYASDFAVAEEQARVAQELRDPYALQALALAQQGQGKTADAVKSYEALASVPSAGRTYTVSGLGDVALYEGRFADAVSLFAEGAKADLAANDGDRAAAKFAALAYTELARGRRPQARAAAEQALANSTGMQIRFLAARVYAQVGAVGAGQGDRRAAGRRAAGRAAGLRQDHRRRDRARAARPAAGDQAAVGSDDAARHLDRPLRSRPRLPGGRRVHAGRLRVRPLPQAQRRGAVAVPRRGADLGLPAAGLLLPGPGARGHEERRLRRAVSHLPRHPRESRGGSAPPRDPQAHRRLNRFGGVRRTRVISCRAGQGRPTEWT